MPLSKFSRAFIAISALLVLFGNPSVIAADEFTPCSPVSEDFTDQRDGLGRLIPGAPTPSLDFCSEWNPEFGFNGHRCCSKVIRAKVRRRRKPKTCTRERFKPNFCDEVTADQNAYIEAVSNGRVRDVLSLIAIEMGRRGDQAYCTVNNGFLAWGRPVVPTAENRVVLRSPDRCTNFGTDNMVGLIEWISRQVGREYQAEQYSGVKVVVGDIAAPRGGCLAGRNGPLGHASHTNGLDADLGFLTVHPGRESPRDLHTSFEPKANWWFLKQIFKNPFACVKVVFLDRKHINKLAKAARGDEDWNRYRRFIRHMPSHKNHFHVRIGDGPGQPGCFPGANPEDETDEGIEGVEEFAELEALRNVDRKISSSSGESSTVQE